MSDVDRSSIFSPAGDTNPLNIADSISEGANFLTAILDALEVIHKTESDLLASTVFNLTFLGQHLAAQIKVKTHELAVLTGGAKP